MVLVEERVWSWQSRGRGLGKAEGVVLAKQRVWSR